MAFKLTIETDNAAFADADGPQELARILRELADKIDETNWLTIPDAGRVHDINGNTVGGWALDARENDE